MKKDISANLEQKCLILCSKILLNVLHNMSLTVLLPWQHTGFQTSPILKAFLATLAFHFHICEWCLKGMIQQTYKYVSLSFGLVWHFSSWKSLTYWNQVGGVWKRASWHGNRIFYSRRCVSCRTISLPSFNGLRCKLAKIALFIYLIWYWVEWYGVIRLLICIFYTIFKLKYLRN